MHKKIAAVVALICLAATDVGFGQNPGWSVSWRAGTLKIRPGARVLLRVGDANLTLEGPGVSRDIPYSSVRGAVVGRQHESLASLGRMFPGRTVRLGTYTRRKTSPSFADALLFWGIFLGVVVGVAALVWMTGGGARSSYMSVLYQDGGTDEYFAVRLDKKDISGVVKELRAKGLPVRSN